MRFEHALNGARSATFCVWRMHHAFSSQGCTLQPVLLRPQAKETALVAAAGGRKGQKHARQREPETTSSGLGQAEQQEASPATEGSRSAAAANANAGITQSCHQQPAFARREVFRACAQTTLTLTAAGIALRLAAQPIANAVPIFDSSTVNALLANEIAAWHMAVVLLLVSAVTGGRLALLQLWPDYAAASDRSNRMVLANLSSADLLWVSFLPGFSEELLFRGALIPALGAEWQAILVSGVVFGALHQEGGRNLAFALWAVVVGCAYGAAYVYTNDLFVPAVAHSLANVLSATLWVQSRKGQL